MSENQNNLNQTELAPIVAPEETSETPAADEAAQLARFDEDLVMKYPKSNRKLNLHVSKFGIDKEVGEKDKNGQTLHISPHGIEFRTSDAFTEGALVKIQVRLPDYWSRKQKYVEYGRVDNPTEFRVLAKVLRSEEVGKRGKKQLVLAKVLIMDSVDEQVLKTFLQET